MPESSASSDSKKFRYLALAEKLQADIEQGKYPIGMKLPSERMLAKEFDATHVTIRQGIEILVRKGLVIREPGSGTYVNARREKPAIGILFGPRIADESAHYYRALVGSLEREIAGISFACRSYDGLNKMEAEQAEQSASYQQLVSDSQNYTFKGFIKISINDPGWSERKPIRDLPSVSHGEHRKDVTVDYYRFGRDCMEFAVRNQRKRILYLRTFIRHSDDLRGFNDAAEELAIPVPEYVELEAVQRKVDASAHEKIRDLATQWRQTGCWPDAVIVSDDIATRGVALGLIQAGIEVPAQTMVITHANEGVEHHYGLDVIRYVISPDEIAKKLRTLLQKRIENPAAVLPPVKIHGKWDVPGGVKTLAPKRTLSMAEAR